VETSQISDEVFADMIRERLAGPMALPVFNAYTETCITTPAEFVLLRRMQGHVEVMLFQRPASDAFFPNAWHSVGGVMLASRSAKDVWESMVPKYGLGKLNLSRPVWAGQVVSPKITREEWLAGTHGSLRGPEKNTVYVVEVRDGDASSTDGGQYFPTSHLPEGLLPHHAKIIDVATRFLLSGAHTIYDPTWPSEEEE
jgi:hypothetical protein